MVKNAEKSVTICTTSKGFIRKAEALKPLFRNLTRKVLTSGLQLQYLKDAANHIKELKNVAKLRIQAI